VRVTLRQCLGGAGALLVLALAAGPPARAAVPPSLGPAWASDVVATSARLHGAVNPGGAITFYRFDYISNASYEANLAAGKGGFTGALKVPSGAEPSVGAGTSPVAVTQQISSLGPETTYRYRIVAKSTAGNAESDPLSITTLGFAGASVLLDGRGWEMVSPVDKNGGRIAAPETLAGGGVFQAAAGGSRVTYGSAASFGGDAQGAPAGSQYVSRRAAAGWTTANITTPMVSGSYGNQPIGVPYQLFSTDLDRGLLLNGTHCRGEGDGCPVANPPLAGSGAPAGYQNYYLRSASPLGFAALVGPAALANTPLSSSHFDLAFAGATADLGEVVLSSCAALTPDATEADGGEGCDAAAPNLYRWSAAGLSLVNLLPAQSQGTPGATLAAPSGAISADGERVYWKSAASGNLYLREGAQTKLVAAAGGEDLSFQIASTNGALAYFTKGDHLFSYQAPGAGVLTDLTPAGGVLGVLGASADGSYLYYLTTAGLFLRHGSTTTAVAAAADPTNYPPATGAARVSADGTRLLFSAEAPLTDYDNTDQGTGLPAAELYLYDASAAGSLICVSCNPTGARPLGPSSVPGAIANGSAPGSTRSYRPSVLSANGRRVFFDSEDSLALGDTNNAPDVYEWESAGEGSCTRSGGCLALVSSGRSAGASFIDASADGADVFFLTKDSLVPFDPGSADLYDARIGGGFAIAPEPIPCAGDACQSLPAGPEEVTVNTLISGPGNRAVRYPKHRKQHRKKRNLKKQKHHRKSSGAAKRHGHSRRGGGR
jgi:hypothetical protein